MCRCCGSGREKFDVAELLAAFLFYTKKEKYGKLLKKKQDKEGFTIKELVELFWVFMKMGAVTFGGGYAMLPIIQREVVEKRGWATEEEVMDYYAIGQCTPGIIAVNTSTFIGYKLKGVLGGFAATFGFVFPSLIIITIIAAFIQNFAHLPYVTYAFDGIRACVCALILDAVIKLGKKSVIDKWCLGICVVITVLSAFTSLSPVILVVLAGTAGICIKNFENLRGEKK